jgi:hypothetical protein
LCRSRTSSPNLSPPPSQRTHTHPHTTHTHAQVERIHAKSEYSKKKFSRTKTQGLLLSFAIAKWGRVSSFSADGSVMLYPNGNPGGKAPKRSSVKKGK